MCVGGSGLNLMMHVRLIVLPLSTYRSGPPSIVAVGTANLKKVEELKMAPRIESVNRPTVSRNCFQSRPMWLSPQNVHHLSLVDSSACPSWRCSTCQYYEPSLWLTQAAHWHAQSRLPTRLFVAAATYASCHCSSYTNSWLMCVHTRMSVCVCVCESMALRNVSKIHRIRSPLDYEMSNDGPRSCCPIYKQLSNFSKGKAAAELVLKLSPTLPPCLSLSGEQKPFPQ